MIKRAYAIQMSFEVPDAEKRIAEKASECFSDLLAKLRAASKHLEIIYVPFSKREKYDAAEINQYRVILRRYRDQVQDNFNAVMDMAYRSILMMGEFATDTQTVELMSAFDSQIKDLRKQVNIFLGLFSNIGKEDFISSLLLAIDSVNKQVNQVKQTINDRILDHIDTNILAKSWTSSITDEYQNKVYEKAPLMVELFQERKKAVNEGI